MWRSVTIKTNNGRPAGVGGIEEAADNILLLYREEYYKPLTPDKNVLEIHVAKQRQGPRGVIVRCFSMRREEYSAIWP